MTTKIFLYLLPPQEGLPGWRECWTRRRPWRRVRSERCWGQGWRPSRPCGWSQQWTRSSSGSCCSAGRWQDPSNKVDCLSISRFPTSNTEWKESAMRSIIDLKLEWLNTAWLCPWLCPWLWPWLWPCPWSWSLCWWWWMCLKENLLSFKRGSYKIISYPCILE